MGEANASFGDSQNYSEDNSNSTQTPTPKRNNRRSRDTRDDNRTRNPRNTNAAPKERKCKCNLCDFSTAYSFSLMRHKEKVHKLVGLIGAAAAEKAKMNSSEVTSPPRTPADNNNKPPSTPSATVTNNTARTTAIKSDPSFHELQQSSASSSSTTTTTASSDPVSLPSMFSSNRSEFIELGGSNFAADSGNSQENAQWSIPNTPTTSNSSSVKFETAEGVPINLFESNYTTVNAADAADFITFRKAEEAGNNVVQTLMNGYTTTGMTDHIPRPGPIPTTASISGSIASSDSNSQHLTSNASITSNDESLASQASSQKSQPSSVNKKTMKRPKSKKLAQQSSPESSNGPAKLSPKKKKSRVSQSSSDGSSDSKKSSSLGDDEKKKRRIQKKGEKILITSTTSKCPLCEFSTKYPSNTGRHFAGIHKTEYNQVLQGTLELEGIKIREDRPKKVKEPKPSRGNKNVELKIPQIGSSQRQDFDNLMVSQNNLAAPTAAQELAQFVQQENLEMYATGEPENIDLNLNTEPIASFIESLLSNSMEPTEWNLSQPIEQQYVQQATTFTPEMMQNYGGGEETVNGATVIQHQPGASQVTNMTVSYMHQYTEIPQVQAITHSQLQPMQMIDVPISNYATAIKVEHKPTMVITTSQPSAALSVPANQDGSTHVVGSDSHRPEAEDEKEAKRQRTLQRKRDLRKQKKMQRDAEKMGTTAPVTTQAIEINPAATAQQQPQGITMMTQPQQTSWPSQYMPIPDQSFAGAQQVQIQVQNQQQNHYDLLKPPENMNHVQPAATTTSFVPMHLQSPDSNSSNKTIGYSIMDHNIAIASQQPPPMSPTGPTLISLTAVPVTLSSAVGLGDNALFYESTLQALPALGTEYPPAQQVNHIQDYNSQQQQQINISHGNDYVQPQQKLLSPTYTTHQSLSHTLPSYENVVVTTSNQQPVTIEFQSPNSNSAQVLTTPIQQQQPSAATALTPATPSSKAPCRKRKEEMSPDELEEQRAIHLAKRREQYRRQMDRKKKKAEAAAASGGGVTPGPPVLSEEEQVKREQRLAKRRALAAARRKAQKSMTDGPQTNDNVVNIPIVISGDMNDKPSAPPPIVLAVSASLHRLPPSSSNPMHLHPGPTENNNVPFSASKSVVNSTPLATRSYPSQSDTPSSIMSSSRDDLIKPKNNAKKKPNNKKPSPTASNGNLKSPTQLAHHSTPTSSTPLNRGNRTESLTPEEAEMRKKEKKREQNRRYLEKKRMRATAAKQALAEKLANASDTAPAQSSSTTAIASVTTTPIPAISASSTCSSSSTSMNSSDVTVSSASTNIIIPSLVTATETQAKNESAIADVQDDSTSTKMVANVSTWGEQQQQVVGITTTAGTTTTISHQVHMALASPSDQHHTPISSSEPIESLDFQKQFLCPAQESQTLSTFGYLNQDQQQNQGQQETNPASSSSASYPSVGWEPPITVEHVASNNYLNPELLLEVGDETATTLTQNLILKTALTATNPSKNNNKGKNTAHKKLTTAIKKEVDSRKTQGEKQLSEYQLKNVGQSSNRPRRQSTSSASDTGQSSANKCWADSGPSQFPTFSSQPGTCKEQASGSRGNQSYLTASSKSKKMSGKKTEPPPLTAAEKRKLAAIEKKTAKNTNKKMKETLQESEEAFMKNQDFIEMNKPPETHHCSYPGCDFKTDNGYKLKVHTTFHDALKNMPPMVRSMLEATGNVEFLMKLQPERDAFNGCLVAKTDDVEQNRNDAVSTDTSN